MVSPIESQLERDLQKKLVEIGQRAVAHFGIPKQVLKLGEEASELSRAVCRLIADIDNNTLANLSEEIIDVFIVSNQVIPVLMTQAEFSSQLTEKLDRLEKLLNANGG